MSIIFPPSYLLTRCAPERSCPMSISLKHQSREEEARVSRNVRDTGLLCHQASVLDWIKNHLSLRHHLAKCWPTTWVDEHEIWLVVVLLSERLQSQGKWRWPIFLNKAGFALKINGQARWALMMNELGLALQAWWRKAFYSWHLKSLLLVNICHD